MEPDPDGVPPDAVVVAQTRRWIQRFVIDLNLCPFARRELDAGRIRFAVTRARGRAPLLAALRDELALLVETEAIATTLLIHPAVLQDFLAYNDFLGDADRLLQSEGLEGILQLASFHPSYQFADTSPHDAENFSNRSPWPMLHLLREDSVEAAVRQHPDAADIPAHNIAVLNALGAPALVDRRRHCMADDGSA